MQKKRFIQFIYILIMFIDTSQKLQSLCRELQNQNRKMKVDQLRITKDEEERRKQLIEKFQGSLENITKQLGKSIFCSRSLYVRQ